MPEILQYNFFVNALIVIVFASISCGIIGTYIVSKRLVFISGGITHASFGGIGIGYYLGLNPILGAAVFAVLSALGIEFFGKRTQVREDATIGILWSFGMAIGIIFIYITPGYAPNLMGYLFGSILTVTASDIYLLAALSAVVILLFTIMFKTILYISYDVDYARTHKIPVSIINYILLALIALTIVLNIKVVGIILVISLLTIPQTIANFFTKDFKKIIWYSIVLAFIGSLGGLIFSYRYNIPSGASIIFTLVIMVTLAWLIQRIIMERKLRNENRLESI
jgi:zinc transport system permease protein